MNNFIEPYELEELRQRNADKGAMHCDCCGGIIRRGDVKYTLGVGKTDLYICEDCKGELVASAQVHGYEEEFAL